MSKNRHVVMIDRMNHVLKTYETVAKAAKDTGFTSNYIYNRCRYNVMPKDEYNNNLHVTFRYDDDIDLVYPHAEIKEYVMENISDRMLMVLIMEECSELIQACSKKLRSADPEGCTPVSTRQATDMFNEEAGDLLMLLEIAGIVEPGTTDNNPKWERWYNRIMEGKKNGNALESHR